MSVPRKQSFHTFLDTSFVLLCYTFFYFPTVFLELFSKIMVTLLYSVILVPLSQYCTSLHYYVVLLSIVMLYFSPSQYCTSLHYYVVLLSIVMLYFSPSQYCTFLYYRVIFSIMTYFLRKITRGLILL
jgi:hypothetical protein